MAGPAAARRVTVALVAAAGLMALPGAAAADGAPLQIVLGLRLGERGPALTRFVDRVSDPTAPEYRRFATRRELDRRFGAPRSTRRAVLRALRAQGVRAHIGPAGAFAYATVSRPAAVRAFGARPGPAAEPRLPAALRPYVDGVVGLDGAPVPGGMTGTAYGPPGGSGYAQRTGTARGCSAGLAQPSFAPNQYTRAYGYDRMYARGYRGEGQRVALIAQAAFRRADVLAFSRCFGLRAPPTHATLFGPGPVPPNPSEAEIALDIDMVAATAPGLRSIEVYQTTTAAGLVREYAEPARLPASRRPQVLASSLATCEVSTDPALLRLIEHAIRADAAVGVSVLSGAGDAGSTNCLANGLQGQGALGIVTPSYPASSPYVTAVGGTNITLDARNHLASETLWNDEPARFLAGGGAASRVFGAPAYQRAAGFRGATRATPDVAMLADLYPGILIYCATAYCVSGTGGGGFLVRGWGTSAAGPMLAGGIALADQREAAHHRAPLGPLNPLLYRLRGRAPVFRDVTHGTNDLGVFIPAAAGGTGGPIGCCTARRGYDMASGWGSVNVAALSDAAGNPRTVRANPAD